MRVLLTGGAGFIGSTLVRKLLDHGHSVHVVDKLTYAGVIASLTPLMGRVGFKMTQADILDARAINAVFASFRPEAVAHLAAETHVDRSIDGPSEFIRTNVLGTQVLLDAALAHYRQLDLEAQARFRFLHISTDEVFGALGDEGHFSEDSPYDPRSPYAASKAASDHLVRAWGNTYGLPVLISNCSNNYGPRQYPEKLIPRLILNALRGLPLPIYGDGSNVRDWLYVDDHAEALHLMLTQARPGSTYCVGGGTEMSNLDLAHLVCRHLDELAPRSDGRNHASAIRMVADRPGHDWRYAVCAERIKVDLGWQAATRFDLGLRQTVRWHIENTGWWQPLLDQELEEITQYG